MGYLWIALLTILPLMAGTGLVACQLWSQCSGHFIPMHIGRAITIAILSAGLIGTFVLWLSPGYHPELSLPWLPNTGMLTIHLAETGLVSAMITTCAALFYVILDPSLSAIIGSLVLMTSSAVNTAFISGQFALRYAALEIVGLGITLVPLLASTDDGVAVTSRKVFMVLRLGDMGLLTAILLLNTIAGTLDIARSLEFAAAQDSAAKIWIVGGFLLAVWVKMGLWPFHRWLTYAHSLSPIANGWFFLTLMPNLGLYLLYRIQPLLANPVSLSPILRWLSLGTAAVLLYLYINQKSGDENRMLIMAIHASLAVTFAAQQCLRVIPVMLYVSALRTSFPMVEKIERRVPRIILSGTIGCSNVIFWGATMLHENTVLPPTQVIFLGSILVCMSVWTFAHLYVGQFPLVSDRKEQVMLSTAGQKSEKFTKQISVTYQIGKKVQDWVVGMFELDVPEKLLSVVTLSVTNVSRWLYRIFEQNTLEKSVSSVAGGILAGGRWLYEVIEFASLEGFLRVIKRFIQALSLRLQRWHTGKLRLNLLWVVLCIVAAVLMLAM